MARERQGVALAALGRREEGGGVSRGARRRQPDRRHAAREGGGVLHNRLYDPASAFETARNWLARHPEDDRVQLFLLEPLFATWQFAACAEHSAKEAGAGEAAIRQGYLIAAQLAQGHRDSVPAALERLIADLAREPVTFHTGWSFAGSRQFVRSVADLPHREALSELFLALEAADRDQLLAGLRRVEEKLATVEAVRDE